MFLQRVAILQCNMRGSAGRMLRCSFI